MIKIRNINKKYNNIRVLKNISYDFKKGLNLIGGASGKGKTTLLNILGGVDKNFEGKIRTTEEILYFRDKDNLPSELTVKEIYFLFEEANEIKIKDYFGIKRLFNKKTKKLSLGELQLVILNMVLNSNSKIVILDEPFSALSSINLNKACNLIEKHAKDKTIIIAAHNIKEFKKYYLLDLDNYRRTALKKEMDFESDNTHKPFKINYYLLYLKKTFIRKIIFLITLTVIACNYLYIDNYSNNLTNEYMLELEGKSGTVIEKVNDIHELNKDIFYEVIKKISRYAYNYNASYYNSELYKYDVKVNEYYIDNGFVFSSFNYLESPMKENEIVIGLDYNDFCENNNIFVCDENYLKTLLVNKKINHFSYQIKDIFDNEETVFFSNKRFNKIYENNEYEEYYFDVKKEDIELMFSVINKDDFLLNFDFIKVGESAESLRYRVELDDSKKFSNKIEYSKYIVCLKNGYNCQNYLNRFETLVSIDKFKDISSIDLEVVSDNMSLDEIVISSALSEKLDKKQGDSINFYLNYNDKIIVVPLMVKYVVNKDKYLICHNSQWSYSFFKEKVELGEEDLQINNIIIYEKLKKGYFASDNVYENALNEIKSLLNDTNRFICLVNVALNGGSILVLFLLEKFCNKFKKEFFNYLKILNVEYKKRLK